MKIILKKGYETETAEINDRNITAVLQPSSLPEGMDQQAFVEDSLHHPIGTKQLQDIVKPGEKIAIITSDNTRPVPTWIILPCVLKELYKAGISKEDITLYFARGSHRNMSEAEHEQLSGEAYHEIACFDSDWTHTVHVGKTSRGTDVDIDERVVKADRRILIGNVEYHYFAGFSGGAKAIFPGMSVPNAIAENHKFMTSDDAHTAKLDGNPVREDIEEAANMVGADFIINVVLNPKKEIIASFAGDMKQAHRKACQYYDSIYRYVIPHKADIVLVSQGGAPKDRNLYQTQKALDNAGHAVKDGGTIIVVASCKEGFGQKNFEEWMLKYTDPDAMLQALHEHFVLGGHKACAIASIRKHAEIDLVNDMDPKIIGKTFLKPYDSLAEALASAMIKYGPEASVIVMPYGGSTLPIVESYCSL